MSWQTLTRKLYIHSDGGFLLCEKSTAEPSRKHSSTASSLLIGVTSQYSLLSVGLSRSVTVNHRGFIPCFRQPNRKSRSFMARPPLQLMMANVHTSSRCSISFRHALVIGYEPRRDRSMVDSFTYFSLTAVSLGTLHFYLGTYCLTFGRKPQARSEAAQKTETADN